MRDTRTNTTSLAWGQRRRLAAFGAALAWAPLEVAEAAKGSEIDRDTDSRHERASSSSSSSGGGGGGGSGDDRTLSGPDCEPSEAGAWAYSSSGGSDTNLADFNYAAQLSGSAFMAWSRLSGTEGGRVLRQDGLGGGAELGLEFFSTEKSPRDRLHFQSRLSVASARILDAFRPAGADYTSTLQLTTVEFDIGPRWVRGVGPVDFTLGFGLGVTGLFVNERFSDDTYLDDTLAIGARLRPFFGLASAADPEADRIFVEAGLAGFAGSLTEHIEDYDSLVDGLRPFMLQPYLRAGYLWAFAASARGGFTYELSVIAGRRTPAVTSHKLSFAFSLGGD